MKNIWSVMYIPLLFCVALISFDKMGASWDYAAVLFLAMGLNIVGYLEGKHVQNA